MTVTKPSRAQYKEYADTKKKSSFDVMFLRFDCLSNRMIQEQFKREALPLRNQLLAYARRLLGNVAEAEDIVQEVYVKLWHMRGELPSCDSVKAMSVHITKNLCLNWMKQRRDRAQETLDGLAVLNEEPEPDVALEQKDTVEHVMRIIGRLPDLQRAILRMKHVDSFEVEEIAELTGSNPDAVRMNLSRARKKVKEEFFKMQKS
jgi:RNA polymerase sigma-70 factor (ECF subfamily)